MKIVLDPRNSSIEEMQFPCGPSIRTIRRAKVTEVPDPIAHSLIKANPELYREATAEEISAATPPTQAVAL